MGRRQAPEINASSMADIAFLLLIFFLVTTEIVEDKGILVKLPPWSNDPPETQRLNERNVFSVLVNKDNNLLVRGEPTELADLRELAKEFIINPTDRSDLSASPTKAIISLKNDRGTSFETYLAVYNELKGAYNELWNDLANERYGVDYSEDLKLEQRKDIKGTIPFVLSEAEPTAFGEE
ncbi:MAG: ExbD/TolR family protein [Saprospiraceae bacterium]